MGAWGTGPFENDSALDMIYVMLKPVVRAIKSRQSSPEDLRAAAEILLALSRTRSDVAVVQEEHIRILSERLARASDDEDWIAGWNKPLRKPVKKHMRATVRKLLKIKTY
jgi:hypothetical protein